MLNDCNTDYMESKYSVFNPIERRMILGDM